VTEVRCLPAAALVLCCLQFSNHTGYPTIKGHVFDGGHLRELLAGLTANELIFHTHLLSGERCRCQIESLNADAVPFAMTWVDNDYSRCETLRAPEGAVGLPDGI
jgi:hypothetical protein